MARIPLLAWNCAIRLVISFWLAGCAYGELLTVRAKQTAVPLDEVEIARAVGVTSEVASRHGLRARRDAQYLRLLGDDLDPHFQELDRFGNDSHPDPQARSVLVMVGVDRARGVLEVVIRDRDSRRPTPFTTRLGEALAESLRLEFPNKCVEVEPLADQPLYFAP
ncbi:MAG: hypothetical protein SFZ23_00015 [Planctomycetota bacterium]|nr:hypothetical protein [Planctomycetota bacterium]